MVKLIFLSNTLLFRIKFQSISDVITEYFHLKSCYQIINYTKSGSGIKGISSPDFQNVHSSHPRKIFEKIKKTVPVYLFYPLWFFLSIEVIYKVYYYLRKNLHCVINKY